MDVAVEIANHVAATAADPMKDLGSLWATYSQMHRVCDDVVLGWSIPLQRLLLCGIHLGT